ncbi:PAS domain S-box protein [Nibribacter ruber]|uniref:histidine kinase n=1 Tax=Nibribacter ruber TaxID=2698458 RepID=A0A6P1NX19_9BACT|nr:CHASE domain-containing protein [Nibribacter ruber]QHL88426.1 PAS domain S-box protein [Nibribacter ruber]
MIISRLKDYYLAIGSFVLVLGITLYAYYVSKSSDQERDAKLFELRTQLVKTSLERRMGHYVQILKGVKGLFLSSDSVTRLDFKQYQQSLEVEKNYPGMQGIGFAAMLTPEQVPLLEQRIRAEGFAGFEVKPKDLRPEYSTILYIEPMDVRNMRAFGFDMYSEPTRREAMEAARDFGKPGMTGKVKLVQEFVKGVQAGFLIYLPVYNTRDSLATIEERRAHLKGFVYAPFRAKDLIEGTLRDDFTDVTIHIYDGKEIRDEDLLYSNDTSQTKLDASGRRLFRTEQVRLAGRTWTLAFKPTRAFSNNPGIDEHNLILLAGSIISLLIFFVTWSLLRYLQSNQLTELITKNTTAGLFLLDNYGYCTFQNPAAYRLLGIDMEDLRKKPFQDVVHSTLDKTPQASPYTSLTPVSFEDTYLCQDGKSIPVSCSVRSVRQRGEVVGYILEVRNVAEERRAQQALLESEARFRNMADNTPVMVWMTDAQKQCTYVNRQWLEFTGSTLEENMGRGWEQFVHPEDKEVAYKAYAASIEFHQEFRSEYRLRRQDGEYRWVLNTGSPRFENEDVFLGYIGSVSDITERIAIVNRLKSNAEMLQRIFMQVPAIVGLVRLQDMTYTLVNSYLSELYGGKAKVGGDAFAALPPSQREPFRKILHIVAQSGKAYIAQGVPVTFDAEAPAQEDVIRFFNIVYEPILDDQNQVESVLTFAVEVTEQVKSREQLAFINEELVKKNEELLRINNDLDNFVYTASHDLRSPLSNLEALTTALIDNASTKDEHEEDQVLLKMVAASIGKLKGTIMDLTEITKVQKNMESQQAEELLFAEVLAGVEEDIAPMIHEAKARINASFEVPSLQYARKNLRSILYNLVSNAVKYRDPAQDPVVNLTTKREGGYIVLTVQDNGLGIRKDQQGKLFSMFRRLHSHVEGTGIGLYIVKRIIENNEGRIEVDSEPGKGTTFSVYFKDSVKES